MKANATSDFQATPENCVIHCLSLIINSLTTKIFTLVLENMMQPYVHLNFNLIIQIQIQQTHTNMEEFVNIISEDDELT